MEGEVDFVVVYTKSFQVLKSFSLKNLIDEYVAVNRDCNEPEIIVFVPQE